jgi:hypothetical protein
MPDPLRSALRVWLPSRRLTPFEALPVLFRTGGAPGISPSELSPLERCAGLSTRADPLAVLPGVAPSAEASGRTTGPRLLGFHPFESPLRPNARLTRQPPATPLGFDPSRVFRRTRRPGFRPDSSHALDEAEPKELSAGATKYQTTFAWPDPNKDTQGIPAGPGNPRRVSVPVRSRTFKRARFRAMCSPRAAPHITADSPRSLETRPTLPELSWVALGTQAQRHSHR